MEDKCYLLHIYLQICFLRKFSYLFRILGINIALNRKSKELEASEDKGEVVVSFQTTPCQEHTKYLSHTKSMNNVVRLVVFKDIGLCGDNMMSQCKQSSYHQTLKGGGTHNNELDCFIPYIPESDLPDYPPMLVFDLIMNRNRSVSLSLSTIPRLVMLSYSHY